MKMITTNKFLRASLLSFSVSPLFYACSDGPSARHAANQNVSATADAELETEESTEESSPSTDSESSPASTKPTQTQGPSPLPSPNQMPSPGPAPLPSGPAPSPPSAPAVDAELKAACRPTQIVIVDQDSKATAAFKNAIGDVNTVLADVAQSDCLSMYKATTEFRRITKIEITIRPFDGVAYANPGQDKINFNSNYIMDIAGRSNAAAMKQEMMGVMVHEINHLYQNFWKDGKYTALSEGVCDAIRAKAGLYPPGRKQKGGNYLGSYTTTGYFLMYLNDKYPDFLYKFNKAAPSWNDNFWQKTLNKSVDQLWNEYQASF